MKDLLLKLFFSLLFGLSLLHVGVEFFETSHILHFHRLIIDFSLWFIVIGFRSKWTFLHLRILYLFFIFSWFLSYFFLNIIHTVSSFGVRHQPARLINLRSMDRALRLFYFAFMMLWMTLMKLFRDMIDLRVKTALSIDLGL